MPRFQQNVRPIINVGSLLHGPIRYDKNTDKAPKLTGYDTGGLDALGDKLMKGAPKGAAAGGNDNAKDPSLLEGIGRAAGDMRTITKAPLDAAASKVPGANTLAKMPGQMYEGAARYVPNAIKDARVGGYRVGDAVDAAAQAFSPVSLDPNATPADQAEQAAMVFSGGKVLGKAAGALGKHGGKIIDGIGLGATFGPDAVSGAADHAARMFGREVPSLAAAGEARALSPRAMHVPQRSNMAASGPGSGGNTPWYDMPGVDKTPAWKKAPDQFKGMASGIKREPGRIKKAWDWINDNRALSIVAGGGLATGTALSIAGLGAVGRRIATENAANNLSPDIKKKMEGRESIAERQKRLSDAAYKRAAEAPAFSRINRPVRNKEAN